MASSAALPRLACTAESCQLLGCTHMQPLALAYHIETGFILMQLFCWA